MRTILAFVPALICAGAMVVCARMLMNHARPDPTDASAPSREPLEAEARDE